MYEMSGRERAIRAHNFEPTDRIPIVVNEIPGRLIRKLLGLSEEEYWANQPSAHFLATCMLGVDMWDQLWFPPSDLLEQNWVPEDHSRWDEPEAVIADLETRIHKLQAELADQAGRRQAEIAAICDHQVKTQTAMGDQMLWIFGMDAHGPAIIDFPYGIYGYKGFFLALALYPDVLDRYWQAQACQARWHNECVVEAARRLDWPRIGYLGCDVTTQRGNMVSPRAMARCFFPHLEHAIEPLVRAGFKLVWHCDGNFDAMLQPLIELGVNGFQGFQEECGTRIRDVAKLRARNGDPLILWGSVSAIDVVRNGTFEDIRREVQRVLDEWPYPGLCFKTSSAMKADVPDDSIMEMYRAMRTLGRVQRSL